MFGSPRSSKYFKDLWEYKNTAVKFYSCSSMVRKSNARTKATFPSILCKLWICFTWEGYLLKGIFLFCHRCSLSPGTEGILYNMQ